MLEVIGNISENIEVNMVAINPPPHRMLNIGVHTIFAIGAINGS